MENERQVEGPGNVENQGEMEIWLLYEVISPGPKGIQSQMVLSSVSVMSVAIGKFDS